MPGRRRMRWIWPVETNFTRLQRRAPLPVGRMMFRCTIFSLALVVLVQAGWSPAAQASETASGFVQQLGEQAIHALREDSGSLAQRETQFRALLVEGFDLNLIGRFVLGRAWKSADKYQRESYLRAFGEFIVRKYWGLYLMIDFCHATDVYSPFRTNGRNGNGRSGFQPPSVRGAHEGPSYSCDGRRRGTQRASEGTDISPRIRIPRYSRNADVWSSGH